MKTTYNNLQMRDVLWGEDPDSEIVSDTISGIGRWSIHHELIFKKDGKTWRTHYSEGATECQDERPFEYDDDVECTEVVPMEQTVIVWVPAP